ncbi:MAG: hypothetical protein R3B55_01555 [Candidatus Paceibacterota bacterium]
MMKDDAIKEVPYITEEGHENAKKNHLKELTLDHFKRVPSACFVVVGKSTQSQWSKICMHLSESLGIPQDSSSRLKLFPREQKFNLEEITSNSCTPGCIGVIASGITPKQRALLEESLKDGKVLSKHYVILSGHKKLQSSELEAQLRKFLECFFEDELAERL